MRIVRTAVVAAVVALLTPASWLLITGETYRAPLIPESLWEHARALPAFIAQHWRGYLRASAVVFAIVFVFLLVFLRRRNRRA